MTKKTETDSKLKEMNPSHRRIKRITLSVHIHLLLVLGIAAADVNPGFPAQIGILII